MPAWSWFLANSCYRYQLAKCTCANRSTNLKSPNYSNNSSIYVCTLMSVLRTSAIISSRLDHQSCLYVQTSRTDDVSAKPLDFHYLLDRLNVFTLFFHLTAWRIKLSKLLFHDLQKCYTEWSKRQLWTQRKWNACHRSKVNPPTSQFTPFHGVIKFAPYRVRSQNQGSEKEIRISAHKNWKIGPELGPTT